MKKIYSIICLAIFCLSIGAVSAFAGWHDLTQTQRNQAIIDEAQSWTTGDDGGQCKEWVRTVVLNASGNLVNIPSNDGYCEWGYDAYVKERNVDIMSVTAGDLVQMTLSSAYGSGPHTLVVLWRGLSGILVRESDWCNPATCETVHESRFVTYSTFDAMVTCYTIYYIE